MMQKFAVSVCKHSKFILVTAVILTTVCVILACRLKSRMELSILFNEDDQVLKDFTYIADNFGGGDFLIVVVKTTPSYKTATLASTKKSSSGGQKSGGRIGVQELVAKFCRVLHDKLSEHKDISYVRLIEPWQMRALSKKGNVGAKQDNIVSILLVKPIHPPTDYVFCRKLDAEVDGIISDCLKRVLPSSMTETIPLEVELTGSYKIVVEDQDSINRDLRISAIIAFVGIFILNVITFKSVRLPVLASIPLLMAIAWTMAIMYFTFGYVNMVTALFPTVILGIGIDYAIHILNCFYEPTAGGVTSSGPRTNGNNPSTLPKVSVKLPPYVSGTLDVPTRVAYVYRKISVSLFIGAITTGVAFFALMTARLNGFGQMGFMGGTGVLLCFAATFLILPSLLVKFAPRIPTAAGHTKGAPTNRSFVTYLAASSPIPIRNIILIGFIVISLAAGYFCSQIGYEVDPRKIQDPENPSLKLQDELIEKLGLSFNSIMIVSNSIAEERKLVNLCMKKYVGEGKPFRSVDSLTLQLDLNMPVPDTKMYIGKDKKLLTYLYASGNAYDEHQLARIVSVVDEMKNRADIGGKIIAGSPLLYYELIQTLKSDLRRSTFFSFLGVAAVLLIGFRSVKSTLLALAPVVLGIVWMLAGMRLANINFTMINAIVTPLIVGIGIDDGVHIIHRYKEEGGDIPKVLRSTGRAIIATSLTTMIGFGSLLTAKHLGFFNMGISAVIGIGACLIISILFLPALLDKLHRKSLKNNSFNGGHTR